MTNQYVFHDNLRRPLFYIILFSDYKLYPTTEQKYKDLSHSIVLCFKMRPDVCYREKWFHLTWVIEWEQTWLQHIVMTFESIFSNIMTEGDWWLVSVTWVCHLAGAKAEEAGEMGGMRQV